MHQPTIVVTVVPDTQTTPYCYVGQIVMMFGEDYRSQNGTGTLIAPDWVLTAAHNLVDIPDMRVFQFILGRNGSTVPFGGPVPGLRYFAMPQYKPRSKSPEFDVGLVQLRSGFPNSVKCLPGPDAALTDAQLDPYVTDQYVFLSGYPEDTVDNKQYGTEFGKLVRVDRRNDRNDLLTWIATTKGMSGSPVLGQLPVVPVQYQWIGIHSGSGEKGQSMCARINPVVVTWIKNTLASPAGTGTPIPPPLPT